MSFFRTCCPEFKFLSILKEEMLSGTKFTEKLKVLQGRWVFRSKKPLTFKKQEITFQIQDPKNPCYPFTNSKFQSERGYRCKTKWDDAIVKTINFFKEISNPRDKATINQENFVTEIPSACLRLNQLLKIIQHHPNKIVLVLCMERGEAEIE